MKKRNIVIAASLGFAQLAFLNAQVLAQTQDTTSLNEVVITASRSPKKVSDIGKIVKVITKEEIAKAQGRTLPELLNTVVGLTIAGSGSNPSEVQAVYLRGAAAGNTLILIDGISANDASNISGEYNISAIAIDQIERIEVLKGASSTLYGSDAVAGVINIITKKGEGKLNANAIVTAGSYGTFKDAIGLNGNLNQTKINFNISNLSSNGFSTATGVGFDRDDFKQQSAGFNLSRFITSKINISAGLQANRNQAGFDAGAFADGIGYRYDKKAMLAHVNAKWNLPKGDLSFIASQNNVKNAFDYGGSLVNTNGYISNLQTVFAYQLTDFIDITSGADYKATKTKQTDDYSAPFNSDNNITSIYTSLFLKAATIFKMELGGRFNHHSQYGANFTYTFNPSVLLAKQIKYYVNISSAYHVPSLYQLNSEYGNLNLKPESSQSYETGFQASFFKDQITITSSVFKRKINDVIGFGFDAYINQNQQNDQGVELEIGLKPSQRLKLDLNYAYITGKIKANDSDIETYNLLRRPKNSICANLKYTINSKWYVGLNYKWNANRLDQYYDSNSEEINVSLASYSRVDAYLQYLLSKKITFFTDIKNISNTTYNDFAGYNAKGINFNAGLKFIFN
jgi:vitamin B12 transporter